MSQLTQRNLRVCTNGHEDVMLYCGRDTSYRYPQLVNAGLGNPYYTVEGYEKALTEGRLPTHEARIKRIAEHLKAGRTVGLYCFCKPKPCHTDVIKRAVEQLMKEDA